MQAKLDSVTPACLLVNPPLSLDRIPGKGRALITTATIKQDQICLVDPPLLAYPSSYASLNDFCSCCFNALPPLPFKCPNCKIALFCSFPCRVNSHPFFLCHALSHIASDDAWSDDIVFLLCAYSLPASSFLNLLCLHPTSSVPDESTRVLHNQLISLLTPHIPPHSVLFHLSLENTTALMSKKKMNCCTLMYPKGSNSDANGAAKARAYGIFFLASMLNHDCSPNVCWFDHVFVDNEHFFRFKALKEIKEGTELCLSYVDANMGYNERQRKLMENFNFECKCKKCKRDAQIQRNREEGEHEIVEEEQEEEPTRDVGWNWK